MGICSSLFYSSDTDKQTLYKRIRPTQEQFDDQQGYWNLLADYLIKDLKERSGYSIRTWLQGSYKFGTQIRPVQLKDKYDIDLGVYFQWKGKPEDGALGPKEIKSNVQESLESYKCDAVIKIISPPKMRCSRIIYRGNFHIDIPSYHLDPDRDSRSLATEGDVWEDSDPKALYLWFLGELNENKRSIARRHIQYLKCWAALKFKETDRPSSTLITVLVAEAIFNIKDNELVDDDESLLKLLSIILERLEEGFEVLNPVNESENLTARLTEAQRDLVKENFAKFCDIADDAINSDDQITSVDKWSQAFEHFFPLPSVEEISKSDKAEKMLPAVIAIPEVSVRAISKDNPNIKMSGSNKIGPIPKNCDIYFRVINHSSFPHGSVFEWMVRNEGDEAENINDLGHRSESGLNTHESSAYKGTHYMDCTAKISGRIIGMRRIPVTIYDSAAPKRNPPKKKPYYRIKGRR